MPVPQATSDHYREQQRLAVVVLTAARASWRELRGGRWERSWRDQLPDVAVVVAAGMYAAANSADGYVGAVLDETGQASDTSATLNPMAFAQVSPAGFPVESTLAQPLLATVGAFEGGRSPAESLALGGRLLDSTVLTMMADVGRSAVATAIAARPGIGGYVRMLNPPSCSRCVVQAGRWFRWNQGFERHPRCDCRHIPSSEGMASDLRLSPSKYFERLPRSEQDRVFTGAGAEAIRAGADVSQVVNARRGMSTATQNVRGWIPSGRLARVDVFGRPVAVSSEGTTRRGIASRERTGRNLSQRLMPESIFEIAESRDDAIKMLTLHGYLAAA